MKKIIGLGLSVFLVGFVFFVGCSKVDSENISNKAGHITIKGSDTMVHLVSSWAEVFMKKTPYAQIYVTGGGSGTGIAAMLNNTTDICAASRKMKPKEYKLAIKKNISPKELVVARDGIAVIVNPVNKVNSLTLEQIKNIYTGVYTDWSQINGDKGKIIVLSRESSSGTYVFFQEKVLQKQDYTQSALLMPATSSIIQTVSSDKNAIGYVGLGYAVKAEPKIKVLGVKEAGGKQPVFPNSVNVKSGVYSLARPLHLYTKGNSEGLQKQFIDFCLSEEGQKIVEETGYVSIN